MWDFNSLTRDRTCLPCIGRQILNHWTTREVTTCKIFYYFIFLTDGIHIPSIRHFKVYNSVVFSTCPRLTSYHHRFQNVFITPKRNLTALSHHPQPPSHSALPCPAQTVGNHSCSFCFYEFGLFWAFHISGILHCVAFWVSSVSLSLMFSGLICVAA